MKEKMIYETMMEHGADGGSDFLVIGPKGQGKTLLLQKMARDAFRKGDLVVWKGKSSDTWSVFQKFMPVNLIVQGSRVSIDHVQIDKDAAPLQNILVSNCESPEDAYELCDRRFMNVIVTCGLSPVQQSAWWTLFFHALEERKTSEWITVVIDEADELYPGTPEDEWYHITNQFAKIFGTLRKNNVSTRFSVHQYTSLYYKIINMIVYFGFVRGGRKIPGRTPVSQALLNNLERGYPLLTNGGLFNILDTPVTKKDYFPQYVDKVHGLATFDMFSKKEYWSILDINPRWIATCVSCGYEWTSRTDNPPRCPRCHKYEDIRMSYGSIIIMPEEKHQSADS